MSALTSGIRGNFSVQNAVTVTLPTTIRFNGGISHNAFFDNTDGRWEYKGTAYATFFNIQSGSFVWNIAPSGTAGNPVTFTQAMTLDSNGDLLVGGTTALARTTIVANASAKNIGLVGRSLDNASTIDFWNNAGSTRYGFIYADAGGPQIGSVGALPMTFNTNGAERMRITSGGYTKISNDGTYVNSTGSFHEIKQTGTSNAVIIWNSSTSANTDGIVRIDATRNTTDNTFHALTYYNAGAGEYKFRVADSGAIATAGSIALGTSTAPTSGIGVKFPATQSASSDANTLDDYEEGTFTPSFTFGGGSTGITYNAGRRFGRYTKIGNVVYYYIFVELTNKGSSTGGALITGLPFTVIGSEEYVPASTFLADMDSITTPLSIRAVTGTTTCDIYQVISSNYSQITNSNFTNVTGLQVSGFYRV
jgi:hypothetical protein